MNEYLPILLDVAIAIVTVFWISKDVRERRLSKKVYYIFITLFIISYLFLGIIGVGIVLITYFVWTRYTQYPS